MAQWISLFKGKTYAILIAQALLTKLLQYIFSLVEYYSSSFNTRS